MFVTPCNGLVSLRTTDLYSCATTHDGALAAELLSPVIRGTRIFTDHEDPPCSRTGGPPPAAKGNALSSRNIRRKAVAALGGVLVATSLIGTAPAFAKSATTTGSKVYTYQTEKHEYFYVKDTKADSRSAGGKYTRKASPKTTRTMWNSMGSGKTARSGPGSSILKMQACRQEQFWPDKCSGWTENYR